MLAGQKNMHADLENISKIYHASFFKKYILWLSLVMVARGFFQIITIITHTHKVPAIGIDVLGLFRKKTNCH
jgi:hypothetical protein